ncbi:MAG: DUF2806 domain-containing protein [Bacteroidetes bacterium]|nr:DUF2806 domain-containing protein [Bacteroidota bacterium]
MKIFKILWPKSYLKEVFEPSSISPITLQILPVITTSLGKLFATFCNLTIQTSDDTCFFYHTNVHAFQNIGNINQYGRLTLQNLLDLEGAGLIRSAEALLSKLQ